MAVVSRIAALLVILPLIGAMVLLVWTGGDPRQVAVLLDGPASSDPTPQQVSVRRGASAATIAAELEQRGLIRSALLFRWLVEVRGVAGKLNAGEYELRPTMTSGEIIELLVRGGHGPRITVIEGWRLEQVAESLEQAGIVSAREFLALTRSPQQARALRPALPPGATLEGYLFPDTYELERDSSALAVVQQMLTQFEERTQGIAARAAARGMTLHETVTLASIIEREAQAPEERPLISAVFHNRLKRGMPLAADPTVQYALATRELRAGVVLAEYWKRELSREDLRIASPYNTYVTPGLPPGPICSPGLAALEAAVAPAPSDMLYFVALGDGRHVFARTYAEHQANLAGMAR